MSKKLRMMTINALLLALSIIIPLISPKIVVGPFSATLASHVPLIIAIFINPLSAIFVAIGSAIGFYFALPGMMVIAARALTHVFFAFTGSYLIKKNFNIYLTLIITGFIHALLEMIVVMIPPFHFDFLTVALWVGVGTLVHHVIDCLITYPIAYTLKKAKILNFTLNVNKIIIRKHK